MGDSLRRRGGDTIEQEAQKDGEHALGECVATGAGTLHAKKVLHAVSAWDETSCVGRAMMRALSLADSLALPSLAMPALGTGAARVSLETCANAMATALRWRLAMGGSRLAHVVFVLADEAKLNAFRDVAVEALRGSDALPRPSIWACPTSSRGRGGSGHVPGRVGVDDGRVTARRPPARGTVGGRMSAPTGQTFPCRQCGAQLTYDAATRGMVCGHCGLKEAVALAPGRAGRACKPRR